MSTGVYEDFFKFFILKKNLQVDLKDKPFFFFLLLLFVFVPFVSSILLPCQQQLVEHLLAVVVESELVLELLAEEPRLLEPPLLLVAAPELVADSLAELSAGLSDTLQPYVAALKFRNVTR